MRIKLGPAALESKARIDKVLENRKKLGIVYDQSSKAVVAKAWRGGGCVLWFNERSAIACQIIEGCLTRLDDLGLDDAPDGLSVWEGDYVGGGLRGMDGDFSDALPVGSFRSLHDDEWRCVRRGVSPW